MLPENKLDKNPPISSKILLSPVSICCELIAGVGAAFAGALAGAACACENSGGRRGGRGTEFPGAIVSKALCGGRLGGKGTI
jgi:hypothetical protein